MPINIVFAPGRLLAKRREERPVAFSEGDEPAFAPAEALAP